MDTQLSAGQKLGNYRVIAALGAGGMGVVYRARDERLNRDVALKILPAHQADDGVARARMLREAQTASALNHPYICHIYEIGEAEGHSFIAMELVEGRPLSASIPQGGLPMDAVIRYGEQIADALEHAHVRGVLHRDIKSSNIILTPEGRVKILDFGLAKRVSEEIANEATLSQVSPLTQAGAIAGTLSYLAPEVLSGHPADARSDLWAAGVVLYEMASGALPFQGRTSFEVSSAILREAAKPLPPRVPPGVRAVVQRCLAKEPTQRYQRASELRAALEALGSGTTQVVSAPGASPLSAPKRKGQPRWLVITEISIFLSILTFLVWDNFFSAHSRRDPQSLASPSGASPSAATSAPPTTAPASGNRLTGAGTPSTNAEANEYFERSMLFLRGGFEPQKARPLLEKALQLDPKFAEARGMVGLIHLLNVESGVSNESAWIYKAEQETRQALADDPKCAACLGVMAAVYYYQGRTEEGLRAADAGIAIAPQSTSANLWKSHLLALRGDLDAGISLAKKTVAEEPTLWPARRIYAAMLHDSGDREGALREFAKILEQDSTNVFTLCELAHMHVESGELAKAREFLERVDRRDTNNYRVRLAHALLLAAEGKHKDARKEMDASVTRYAEQAPGVTLTVAEFHAMLDEIPQSLAWFEKAVRNGDERVAWFKTNPLLAKVRENPRFQQVIDSIAFRRNQK